MTRKHFRALADALKSNRPGENWDANKKVQWNLDIKAVAVACHEANGGFKPERFYAACGGFFTKDGVIL